MRFRMTRVDFENIFELDHRFLILLFFVVLLGLREELGEFFFVALAAEKQRCEEQYARDADGSV